MQKVVEVHNARGMLNRASGLANAKLGGLTTTLESVTSAASWPSRVQRPGTAAPS